MPRVTVECADALKVLYRRKLVWDQLAALAICGFFIAAGVWLGKIWIGAAGIVAVGGFVIVPRLLRFDRAVKSLQCPFCGHGVGNYSSKRGIIHLRCKCCGEESTTDCMIPYAGAAPVKI